MTEKILKKKKKKKESPSERGRGKSCQGFLGKNTTRRVEIFSTKPEGLDLYSCQRLAKEAPYLRCLFLIFFGEQTSLGVVLGCGGVGEYVIRYFRESRLVKL